jgi:predicted O-methyltransferase YrrM
MTFEAVEACLSEFRFQRLTSPSAGRLLYDLVLRSGAVNVLELGFAHGTSTMYLAAALDELGSGVVTTLDREVALERTPNLHQLAAHLGLEHRVRPLFAARSYNWELKKLVAQRTDEQETRPCFDLCFIDGSHTWYDDGLAFFLVDKLLRENRWIVFDDLYWTAAGSPSADEGKLRLMPPDERESAQVFDVFNLLVRPHPAYGNFRVVGNYAAAYKLLRSGELGDRADAFDAAASPDLIRELAFSPLRRSRRTVSEQEA